MIKILYFDTDSIICSWKLGQLRLEHGRFIIGQFKDKIEDEYGSGTYTSKSLPAQLKSYGSRKLISKIKGIMQSVWCLQQPLKKLRQIREHHANL